MGILDLFRKSPAPASTPVTTSQPRQSVRLDGFEDLVKGVNGDLDINARKQVVASTRLDYTTLNNLYLNNQLLKNVIDIIPDDAQRQPLGVCDEEELSDKEIEEIKKLLKYFHESGFVENCNRAWKNARLHGTSLLFPIFDGDNDDYSKPINLNLINTIKCFRIYDKTQITIINNNSLGIPETYSVSSFGGVLTIHESRVLRFNGDYSGEYNLHQNNYHYESIVNNQILDVLFSYDLRNNSLNNLLLESSVGVLQVSDLNKRLANKDDTETNKLIKRFNLQMMMKSIMSVLLIDGADTYKRENIPNFTGIMEIVKEPAHQLALLTQIPKDKLLGETTGNKLNNSGDSQQKNYADLVKTQQILKLKGNYDKAIVFCKAMLNMDYKKPLNYEFESIIQENKKEKAETEKIEMETKKIEADIENEKFTTVNSNNNTNEKIPSSKKTSKSAAKTKDKNIEDMNNLRQ